MTGHRPGTDTEGSVPVLVFVYNVDASPVAMLKDAYLGITTGSTDCNLCDLTFGKVLKDRTWKAFVADLPHEVDFQLRSTFRRDHPELADEPCPALYLERAGAPPEQLLDAAAIDDVSTLDELRALVEGAVDG